MAPAPPTDRPAMLTVLLLGKTGPINVQFLITTFKHPFVVELPSDTCIPADEPVVCLLLKIK